MTVLCLTSRQLPDPSGDGLLPNSIFQVDEKTEIWDLARIKPPDSVVRPRRSFGLALGRYISALDRGSRAGMGLSRVEVPIMRFAAGGES